MTIIQFSEWLQDVLTKRNMKPQTLAEKADLDPGMISRILSRERMPNNESLLAIAGALEIPPDEVFRGAGILPEVPELTQVQERALFYLSQLNSEDQERVMLYLEVLAARYRLGGERP